MAQTISEEYRKLQQDLHKNPHYGVASLHFANIVAALMKQVGAKSVADYGAGKQNLLKGLAQQGVTPTEYFPYDPAFPEYGPPRTADLLCCIDVLEHIEPDLIDNVIDELASLTSKYAFFTIATGPAEKVLADGRNAHLIQKPTSWWLPKLAKHFEVMQLMWHHVDGFWVIVKPIEKPAAS